VAFPGFSKYLVTSLSLTKRQLEVKVLNFDGSVDRLQCPDLPQLPVYFFPTLAELLHKIPVICGADILREACICPYVFLHTLRRTASYQN
jgi:hypothetical protein